MVTDQTSLSLSHTLGALYKVKKCECQREINLLSPPKILRYFDISQDVKAQKLFSSHFPKYKLRGLRQSVSNSRETRQNDNTVADT